MRQPDLPAALNDQPAGPATRTRAAFDRLARSAALAGCVPAAAWVERSDQGWRLLGSEGIEPAEEAEVPIELQDGHPVHLLARRVRCNMVHQDLRILYNYRGLLHMTNYLKALPAG